MSTEEAFIFLFFDVLLSNMIVPIRHELVFVVMGIFGTYNMYIVVLLALLASCLAVVINWLLGMAFRSLRKSGSDDKALNNNNVVEKIIYALIVNFKWLLLFAFIPIVGSMLVVIAGFLQVKLANSIFFAMVGFCCFYILRAIFI